MRVVGCMPAGMGPGAPPSPARQIWSAPPCTSCVRRLGARCDAQHRLDSWIMLRAQHAFVFLEFEVEAPWGKAALAPSLLGGAARLDQQCCGGRLRGCRTQVTCRGPWNKATWIFVVSAQSDHRPNLRIIPSVLCFRIASKQFHPKHDVGHEVSLNVVRHRVMLLIVQRSPNDGCFEPSFPYRLLVIGSSA